MESRAPTTLSGPKRSITSVAETLTRLTDEEHALYDSLKSHRRGQNVRLEQERIAWTYAWEKIARE